MPRVTKKQKEQGAKPKPKKGKAPVAGSKFTGVSGGKGKGFKVGPSHAARNSYIGKGGDTFATLTAAQKKKAELIEAAKVKKAYAKVLAAEGMKSARVGGDVSSRDKFFQSEAAPKVQKAGKGKGRAEEDSEEPDPETQHKETEAESDYLSDSSDDGSDGEAAAFARAMRARVKDSRQGVEKSEPKAGKGRDERRKPYSRPDGRKPASAPRVRALSRSPPPAPMAPRAAAAEFREKKREAFAKRHVGRARGQPNMAARMDVLLDKIKRDTR